MGNGLTLLEEGLRGMIRVLYRWVYAHFVKNGMEGIRFNADNVWRSTITEIYSNLLGFIEQKKLFSRLRIHTGLQHLYPKKLLERVSPLIEMTIFGNGSINPALVAEFNKL